MCTWTKTPGEKAVELWSGVCGVITPSSAVLKIKKFCPNLRRYYSFIGNN